LAMQAKSELNDNDWQEINLWLNTINLASDSLAWLRQVKVWQSRFTKSDGF
jgi:hypothetical protein